MFVHYFVGVKSTSATRLSSSSSSSRSAGDAKLADPNAKPSLTHGMVTLPNGTFSCCLFFINCVDHSHAIFSLKSTSLLLCGFGLCHKVQSACNHLLYYRQALMLWASACEWQSGSHEKKNGVGSQNVSCCWCNVFEWHQTEKAEGRFFKRFSLRFFSGIFLKIPKICPHIAFMLFFTVSGIVLETASFFDLSTVDFRELIRKRSISELCFRLYLYTRQAQLIVREGGVSPFAMRGRDFLKVITVHYVFS